MKQQPPKRKKTAPAHDHNWCEATRARLNERKEKGEMKMVHRRFAAGEVSYFWLQRFATGQIDNPRIKYVERLCGILDQLDEADARQ